jgi:polyphenol oxidase
MYRKAYGALAAYEFESLRPQRGLAHGIFTRHGGVSPSPWHSLNLSTATGDCREHIDENYRRVYGALGHSPATAVISQQVHGTNVAVVTGAQAGRRLDSCDGLVTDVPGIVLLQRHADCVPILLYDPTRPAIGVAHAGWRGTLAGMAGEMVRVMCEAFGSRPGDLIAAIGPSIGPCCYDVGAEVQRGFRERHAEAGKWLAFDDHEQQASTEWHRGVDGHGPSADEQRASSLRRRGVDRSERSTFEDHEQQASSPQHRGPTAPPGRAADGNEASAGADGKVRLDLWAANRSMLTAAGVREIEVAGICTACSVGEFYSARAENRRNGCFGAVIALV